jgi:hypothetical protein
MARSYHNTRCGRRPCTERRVLIAGHIALRRVVESVRGSPLALLGIESARIRRGKRTAVRLSCNKMEK